MAQPGKALDCYLLSSERGKHPVLERARGFKSPSPRFGYLFLAQYRFIHVVWRRMAGHSLVRRMVHSSLGPNPQSIAGATVGLVAAFQVWLTREPLFTGPVPRISDDALRDAIHRLFLPEDFSLLQVIAGDTLGMGAFCLVFLIGTLLAFLSPVGAFLQIFGILGFALSVGTYDPVMYPSSWDAVDGWSLGLGYALGVVSTMIVMQSPVRAMLAANGGKPVRMLGRFAALSPQTISSWR
jgi:hypothetical protein